MRFRVPVHHTDRGFALSAKHSGRFAMEGTDGRCSLLLHAKPDVNRRSRAFIFQSQASFYFFML